MFWEVQEAEDDQEVWSYQILSQKGHRNHWDGLRWACVFEQALERIESTKELTGKGRMVVRDAEAGELS